MWRTKVDRVSIASFQLVSWSYKNRLVFLIVSLLSLWNSWHKQGKSNGNLLLHELSTTTNCGPCPLYTRVGNDSRCCIRPNPIQKNPKVTALLSIRNVDSILSFWIRHLAEFCDSIVVLDDHSDDQTILELKLLSRYYPIEAIVYFTGIWKNRDELGDRKTLLALGRHLQGTHFVVVDYDEIFDADCVLSGRLRKQILLLRPGNSLYIPWIFPWNGTRYHAIPRNGGVNLLNRTLTTIFADNENLDYPNLSYNQSKQVSIHIARVPNFRNGSKPVRFSFHTCKILDLRFISVDNLERKLLWYDGLGRIFNISQQVRGKVFRVNEMQFCLEPMLEEWVRYGYFKSSLFYNLDKWRCQQLRKWQLAYPYLFTETCRDCKIARHWQQCTRRNGLSESATLG